MKYTTQTWYHLAMTYDGNGVSLYVNGELQFTAAGTVTPTASQPLLLGARNNGGDPNWVLGIIDDVRIWNHARTKDQIQANMKAVLSGSEAGLIAYYRMDQQNGGQKMLDYTTKAHTGTLGNAAGADGQDPIWVNVTSPQQGCGL